MAVLRTFVKDQGRYYLTNNEVTDLSWELQDYATQTSLNPVLSGTLSPAEQVEITPPNEGSFSLLTTNQAVETLRDSIYYYPTLIDSIVCSIYNFICGCGATPCLEGVTVCDALGTLSTQINYLLQANAVPLSTYFIRNEDAYTLFKATVNCDVNGEAITGSITYNETMHLKIMFLNFYLLYFQEFDNAVDTDDETFINNKYDIERILSCLSVKYSDVYNYIIAEY